ncbi:hypothetical protein BN946_scf184834.g52 [Trametes cinnabarina]|uniref:AN1-type domain-containing protein n=1 Tax=Pycnoporus cinnabarinus TaxID=5643 RepID=A0A060S3Z5_PYCCI|nr:hypothetical protein BN946_scf184834.g52 [Trametes cinnabarina]
MAANAQQHTATAEIGAHCALSSCNINDFLPIRCGCGTLFCRDHVAPDAHDCPLLVRSDSSDAASSSKLQRCAYSSCNKPSLEAYLADPQDAVDRTPARCSGCHQAFCAEHREPKAHSCVPSEPTEPVPQKNAAAKALLAKHFGPSPGSSSKAPPRLSTNPKKLAQQRQLAVMKMRHKAQPADPKDTAASVSIDQRLHAFVRKAGEDPAAERVLWFRKVSSISFLPVRSLEVFRMPISDTQPLKLLYVNDEHTAVSLRTDQALVDQIPDGATLLLSR